MSREIRRVPPDWDHPQDAVGEFIPLFGRSFATDAAAWDKEQAEWAAGIYPSYADEDDKKLPFEEWNGDRPKPEWYMPDWPDEACTHYQMYETTTEGTPKSPVFATPEEVARFCADFKVSAFGGETASYEAWLRVARGGWAPSMMRVGNDPPVSGVEALEKYAKKEEP